jgi:hypothetical protein
VKRVAVISRSARMECRPSPCQSASDTQNGTRKCNCPYKSVLKMSLAAHFDRRIASSAVRFSRLDRSPVSSPMANFRISLRRILPLRVLGNSAV